MDLRKHHYDKASGGDEILAELFQILKDDAVKVLHSIHQQIWKTQQWPHDWKRSVFIPVPKKGNTKKYSDYHTAVLILYASKEMATPSSLLITAKFSKSAGILSAALSQHHLLGYEIAQLEFHYLH